MPEEFHNLEIALTCPECGHERKAPISRLTPDGSLPCFQCYADIFISREEVTSIHHRFRRLIHSLADTHP
ncbi:hypothetical protein [Thiohalorhabdus methylotrophus]|uniref:Uncharacterized protein n=1 Tax=Thiohalorhabdus methylotrophus TaxID=3242694 RepID=A0ABV4TVK4_9GAMM